MGKALSIKDTATYELVAELSAKKGVSMTQAVKEAVSDSLLIFEAKRLADVDAWLERMNANPLPEDAWVEPFDLPMPDIEAIWPK